MELYLATMIRQVDSSLLEEWEKMRDPELSPRRDQGGAARLAVSRGSRRRCHARYEGVHGSDSQSAFSLSLRGLVIEDYEQAAAGLNSPLDADGQPWTPDRLRVAFDEYHVEHQHLCLDPNARNIRHTYVVPAEDKKTWRVQQMLVDPEKENNDWVAEFEVDLAESRKSGEPFMRLRRMGSLT